MSINRPTISTFNSSSENPFSKLPFSEAIRGDKKAVLAAVKQESCALEYASAALQNDREVVLAAVNRNSCALRYASAAVTNSI